MPLQARRLQRLDKRVSIDSLEKAMFKTVGDGEPAPMMRWVRPSNFASRLARIATHPCGAKRHPRSSVFSTHSASNATSIQPFLGVALTKRPWAGRPRYEKAKLAPLILAPMGWKPAVRRIDQAQ